MKKHLIHFLMLAAIVLSSCNYIFLPKKQKVHVKTSNSKSEVYVNKEMVGKGKSFYPKIDKEDNSPAVVVRTEGYKDNHTVFPKTRRTIAFYPLMLLDVMAMIPLYVYAGAPVDKAKAFEKEHSLKPGPKLVNKNEKHKYINISKIGADIKDVEADIRRVDIDYAKNMKLASFDKAEAKEREEYLAERKRQKAKAAKKAARSKKKVKMLDQDENADEDKNTISYDNTIFSYDIYNTLNETGFIDTVNKIFYDNNNTLVLEGLITRVTHFDITPNKRFAKKPVSSYESPFEFYKSKVYITWYIKNTYGEKVDSIVTTEYSGEFPSMEKGASTRISDAIDASYLKLHQNRSFRKYLKMSRSFASTDPLLKLKRPSKKSKVVNKMYASDASVIVKTEVDGEDAGHGSGFAISEDGYILTNYHVVAGEKAGTPKKIIIINSEGKEVEGKLIRFNKFRDVALIKVEQSFKKVFDLNAKKTFKRMQDVYTIGAPKSIELGQSVSSGLISNEREFNNNPLLQLNMAVNAGNSGGPVFDKNGALHGLIKSKLIGANTEGVSFAVPAYLIKDYLNIYFK